MLTEPQMEWVLKCFEVCDKFKNAQDWEGLSDQIILFSNVYAWTFFKYYECLPDHLKYQTAISAYSKNGDMVPLVRKCIREALKYRPKNALPEEILSQKEITIYRAGEEPIEKAKYRISWTSDIEVARKFLYVYNYSKYRAKYLYKGVIKTDKIIAYYNEREEHEILQYRNVQNIKLLEEKTE